MLLLLFSMFKKTCFKKGIKWEMFKDGSRWWYVLTLFVHNLIYHQNLSHTVVQFPFSPFRIYFVEKLCHKIFLKIRSPNNDYWFILEIRYLLWTSYSIFTIKIRNSNHLSTKTFALAYRKDVNLVVLVTYGSLQLLQNYIFIFLYN